MSILSIGSTALAYRAAFGSTIESRQGSAIHSSTFDDKLILSLPKSVRGYRGIMGDLIVLKEGSIMMSFTEDGIKAMKSLDRGKTWSKPFSLLANPTYGNIAHPSFVRLDNGEILISYIYRTLPDTPYYGHNYYRRSTDEGKTWTDQFILTPYPGYVNVHNDRIHRLSTGRLLATAAYKKYFPNTRDHNGYVGMTFYSDDQGHSWQPSKNMVDMAPIEVQEGDCVELRDGRVMMFARSYSNYAVRAYSQDYGETWSKGELMKEIEMPYAGLPTVRRIPSTGDLVFIWISGMSQDKDQPEIKRRSVLSCAISKDEGKTIVKKRDIANDKNDDFGYQCVEFLNDEQMLVGYHCREGIRMARIGIDWLYE